MNQVSFSNLRKCSRSVVHTDTDTGDTKGEGSSEAETEIPKPEDVDLPEPAEPETIDDTSDDTEKASEGTDKVDAPT